MIKHTIASGPLLLFGGAFFEYILAMDGVYLRAERAGLRITLNIAPALCPIRGVIPIEERFEIVQKVSAATLTEIITTSRSVMPNEILFYLAHDGLGWQETNPDQVQSPGRVRPAKPNDTACQNALIEIHSHHRMEAYFSLEDDLDESVGFRVYAVLGTLDKSPTIRVRVGVHGHLLEIPACLVFDLPPGVRDVNVEELC